MGTFVQRFPRSFGSNDLTYVVIEGWKLNQQNLRPRTATFIDKGPLLHTWNFIGFQDIQESVSHTWEPYGSIQGRMNQLIAETKEGFTKVTDVINTGTLEGMAAALSSGTTDAAKYKIDSPIVYTASNRRQISFTFTLMEWEDAYADVLEPIHELRRLSCASIADESIDKIEWPAIFSIKTNPQSFVDIKDAALTDVQITWNSHHKAGNPTRAELTLTFLDLRPLYKSSWGEAGGGLVTVEAPQRELARNRQRGL